MAAPADGRFTAGIQGTSLSMAKITSARASTGFCATVWYWKPACSGWSAGKLTWYAMDSSTGMASSSHSSTSVGTAAGSRPR